MIQDIPLDSITVEDITNLIVNKTIELNYLEYKQCLPDNNDSSKQKFLANITSFANTSGGTIIFGMKEDDVGQASEIVAFETQGTDKDFLRLLQLIQDGIEPRIPSPKIREIKIAEKKVYILRIQPSYHKPHRLKSNQKFYGRKSNGRYELDVDELRSLFLFSDTIEEKMEKFKIQRLLKIKSNDFPFSLYSDKIMVLQIVPIASLNNRIKLSFVDIDSKLNELFPLEARGHNNLYNFDGRLNYQLVQHDNTKVASYLQVFRSGIIETVNATTLSLSEEIIYGKDIEKIIRDSISRYIDSLEKLDIIFPFFISIAFLNVKGFRIQSTNQSMMNLYRRIWGDFGGIYDNDLILPTTYVENENELLTELDNCFEVFWNTDGFMAAPE